MFVEKNYLGAYVISDIVNNERFVRVYSGYSKQKAIALFKQDVKRNEGK